MVSQSVAQTTVVTSTSLVVQCQAQEVTMPPSLPSVCFFLLAIISCFARPNWHKGVVVVKDSNLHHLGHLEYNGAQIAAAQAIRNAGEDAQLHLAMLKKKYMDIVRRNFYNAFAPLPFVKERLDNFEPNLHHEEVPVKSVAPQPLYMHHSAAHNPCSGNILNCLHPFPSRKIVPSPSVGLQPCFGPTCNHALFYPYLKPMVLSKPSHTSYSNKYPSKRPHKHRICDRKRPDQNCHHQTTFWPTYATVKFSTKLNPSSTTFSPKATNHGSVLTQMESLTPGTFVNKHDEDFGFDSLRANTSKLENEILGIPVDLIPNRGVQTDVKPSTETQSPYEAKTDISKNVALPTLPELLIPSTTEEGVKFQPELKEDLENIPPLKNYINQVQSTTKSNFHENDVIESSTYEVIKSSKVPGSSFEEGQKIITFNTFPITTTEPNNEELLKFVHKADPSVQEEIAFQNVVPTNKVMPELTTVSSREEQEGRTTQVNLFVNEIKEGKTDDTTIDKMEVVSSTFDQTSAWKSGIEGMSTFEPLEAYSPTTYLTNDHETAVSEYSSENNTPINAFPTTTRSTNGENLRITTITDHEANTRMYDNDLSANTQEAVLVQQREEATTLENINENEEFTTLTNLRTYIDSTTNAPEYLGREDTAISGTDSWKSAESITTPVLLFNTGSSDSSYLFDETTTEESSIKAIEQFFTTAQGQSGLSDSQEGREDIFTDSYKSTTYPTGGLIHIETTNVETAETFPGRLGGIELDTTEMPDTLIPNHNIATDNNQEGREDIFTEAYQTNAYSTLDFDGVTTEGKVSKLSLEEGTNSFQSTIKVAEEQATEKSETTEYFPQAREELFQGNSNPLNTVEDTTSNSTPAEEVLSFTTDIVNEIVDGKTEIITDDLTHLSATQETLSQRPPVTESEQLFSTSDIGSEFQERYTEHETPVITTSQTYAGGNGDITIIDKASGWVPELRQGEEEELQSKTESIETTTLTSTNKRITDLEEENTLITVTEVTNVPELTGSNYESNPVPKSFEEGSEIVITEETVKDTIHKSTGSEEESFKTVPTIPKELFGKTDTPGLLFSEDWTEEQTEETSLPDFIFLGEGKTTEYPQSRLNEEDSFSEIPFFPVTYNSNTDVSQSVNDKSTQIAQDLTSNYQTHTTENSGRVAFESIEGTTQVYSSSENPLLPSYQSGVLKFTTEIETSTENALQNEGIEGTTNLGWISEPNVSLNRKARSVKHIREEVMSYPTTECVLCLLGLPHGHRMRRSPENKSHSTILDQKNTANKTKIAQHEKSNCSFSTNLNLEDPENSKFYASTILELLPVIREGYRNNAFSEEDKKVIKSLFGDMKALMDEETFEKMTESTVEHFMGDGASRIDEIIEEIDYDSSETIVDEGSEKERLKRSKKNFQVVNDLLKKIPNNLKGKFDVPSQFKNYRTARSTHISQAEASAFLALLAEKGGDIQVEVEDDDEYEYYEDEEDEYGEEDSDVDLYYEDDYDKPSFGELIKIAKRHKERKARAENM